MPSYPYAYDIVANYLFKFSENYHGVMMFSKIR